MKKLLLILLCLPMIGFGQQTYVPDDNFEQELIANGYDNVLDDYVTTSNINTITTLQLVSPISDLTGIEDFTALSLLHLGYSLQITSLDLSNNIALTTLIIWAPSLTSLDVSNNTALTYLQCLNTQLTSLDVSNNNALEYLQCNSNQLTSLNLNSITTLDSLDCYFNQLTNLDVSSNTSLVKLQCGGNQISSLDVSNNLLLTTLECENNPLGSLDVSSNSLLVVLDCDDNLLSNLDVSNNNDLIELDCKENLLTSLDLSNNTSLIHLECDSNKLTSLNISNNPNLIYFDCSNNNLTSLDLRNGNNNNLCFEVVLLDTLGITIYDTIWSIHTVDNPNLTCINVDNSNWSTTNWLTPYIDPQHYFSNSCSGTSIQEHTTNKELLKVTDLLGRETKGTKNEILFYIYDDGTVEKRIVIE